MLLQAIAEYKVKAVRDSYFNDFAQQAIRITAVQAVVIFFGGESKFIKAVAGNTEYPQSKINLICSLINQPEVYTEAEDLLRYDQFKFSAVLLENPVVRFIGKEPIFSKSGLILGSICLMDERPKKMTSEQIQQLKILSNLITRHLESIKEQA